MLSISEIAARQDLYQFFSSMLLKEPNEELVEGLFQTIPYLKESFADQMTFEQWDEMHKQFQNGERTVEHIQQDFYDIFFVPISGKYSPAVESIILHNNMWGEVEREMAERFEKAQFTPEDLEIYVPFKQLGMSDLLGYQLAYMAHLCNMETYSSMEVRQQIQLEELDMIENHLIPVLQKYMEQNSASIQDTIYGPIVELLFHYIKMDGQMISENGGLVNA